MKIVLESGTKMLNFPFFLKQTKLMMEAAVLCQCTLALNVHTAPVAVGVALCVEFAPLAVV